MEVSGCGREVTEYRGLSGIPITEMVVGGGRREFALGEDLYGE